MLDQIDKVDGVKWSLGMNSLIGPTFPESMIPSNIKKMLQFRTTMKYSLSAQSILQQRMNATHSLMRFRRLLRNTVLNQW